MPKMNKHHKQNFRMHRLYVKTSLGPGVQLEASRTQFNYLINVLRYKSGNRLLVFNGRDGEWLAEISTTSRHECILSIVEQCRVQSGLPDLHYMFAPLKHARLDYMVQKAVEMGVGTLRPVITQHTQSRRLNLERIRKNILEASEQCGVLAIPKVLSEVDLDELVGNWSADEGSRQLIYCDESEEGKNPVEILENLKRGPIAVLIGPEGGFSESERCKLRGQKFVTPIPLGPRIMRADTAAVAALAVVQSVLGDWLGP